jgi:hypothetical protein
MLNLFAARIDNKIKIPVPINVYTKRGTRLNIGAITCVDNDKEYIFMMLLATVDNAKIVRRNLPNPPRDDRLAPNNPPILSTTKNATMCDSYFFHPYFMSLD